MKKTKVPLRKPLILTYEELLVLLGLIARELRPVSPKTLKKIRSKLWKI